MQTDLASSCVVRELVAACIMGDGAQTPDGCDMEDSQQVEVIVSFTKGTDTISEFKIFDIDTETGTPVERTDVTGTGGTTISDTSIQTFTVPNPQRWLEVTYTSSGANADSALCVIAIGTHLKSAPADTPVTSKK